MLGELLDGNLKIMPRFNGENGLSIEYHLTAFQYCIDNFSMVDDDVFS
jgi:hypothetical protein